MGFLLIPFTGFYVLKSLFDAIDAAWIGVIVAFAAVIVNVPANWIMIHGIGDWGGLGLIGAGLASLVSQFLTLVLGVALWRYTSWSEPARQPTKYNRAEARAQLQQGSMIAAGYISEGGAYTFAGLMIGWFGAVALAANQIVAAIGDVLYMVPLGVAIAVSIRIGQAMGSDEQGRVPRIGLASLLVVVTWMFLVMVILLLMRGTFASAFSNDAEVIALAFSLFLVTAALQIADGMQGTMLGAARGMTDNAVPVAITLICYWCMALPAAYLFAYPLGMGPVGIWIGYGLGIALAGAGVTMRFFHKSRRL